MIESDIKTEASYLIVRSREEEHLTDWTEIFVDSDALVLVTLSGDHHIRLVQHEHRDLLQVEELELDAPVQNLQTGNRNSLDNGST